MPRCAGPKESLTECRDAVLKLRERFQNVGIDDKGDVFNSDLLETLEVGFMIDYSLVQVEGALAREESRGAHLRLDGPIDENGNQSQMPRDDENWLKHTYAFLNEDGSVKLDFGEVYLLMNNPTMVGSPN